MSCNKHLIVIEMITDEEDLFLFLQYGNSLPSAQPTGRPVFNKQMQSSMINTEWQASAKIKRAEKVYAKGPKETRTKPTGGGIFPSPSIVPYLLEYTAREFTTYGGKQYD
jgi:hypothetical protein